MPVMDGFTATHIIRTQPPFNTNAQLRLTPIVALVAHSTQHWEQCAQAGMDDLMMKPFKKAVFKQLLLKWSREEVLPVGPSRMGRVPAWGPHPLRAYRGPRSLL
jgi:CheY-like chemotaxis protein